MKYTSVIRSQLSKEERSVLKSIARTKGMTLTGYMDAVLRQAIEDGQARGTQDRGARQ